MVARLRSGVRDGPCEDVLLQHGSCDQPIGIDRFESEFTQQLVEPDQVLLDDQRHLLQLLLESTREHLEYLIGLIGGPTLRALHEALQRSLRHDIPRVSIVGANRAGGTNESSAVRSSSSTETGKAYSDSLDRVKSAPVPNPIASVSHRRAPSEPVRLTRNVRLSESTMSRTVTVDDPLQLYPTLLGRKKGVQ